MHEPTAIAPSSGSRCRPARAGLSRFTIWKRRGMLKMQIRSEKPVKMVELSRCQLLIAKSTD